MKVLVCGSRSWRDGEGIRRRLARFPRGTEIVSGGARGADRMAADIARGMGFAVDVMLPFWTGPSGTYNPKAGFERNLRMLDAEPDLVLAFWDGKSTGTGHTIKEAQKRGIHVEVVSPFTLKSMRYSSRWTEPLF